MDGATSDAAVEGFRAALGSVEQLEDLLKEMAERKANLIRVFEELDLDGSGTLDLEEVGSAYKTSPEFKNMMMHADIKQDQTRSGSCGIDNEAR